MSSSPEQHPRNVDPHPPTALEPETREETIAKAVGEGDQVQDVTPSAEGEDPTTRRGLNRAVVQSALRYGAVGFVVGAVIALILGFLPGPFEADSWGGRVGYMVILGAAFALLVAMLATLMLLAREDGRVERNVEAKTGRSAHEAGPGSPGDREDDLTP